MIDLTRRSFIKTSALLTAPLILPSRLWGQSATTKLTILHTNDTHSRFDPYRNGKRTGLGGVARRGTLINCIKKNNPNTLLLDGGDAFQGTPYFNFYEGKMEHETMSLLGYHYATLGNHEFDLGVDKLLKAMQYAKFQFLSSNYCSELPAFQKKVLPYTITTVGNIKIGLTGVGIPFKGLVSGSAHKGVSDLDPLTSIKQSVVALKKAGVQLIILLSHSGIENDEIFAKQCPEIDIIVGGHSHTLLKEPHTIPGSKTKILQVGDGGIALGQLNLFFQNGAVYDHHYQAISIK